MEDIRKKIKIKAFRHESVSCGFAFPIRIEFREDAVISAQSVVDIPHKIGTVFINFVIVGISAAVAAKFFVLASDNFVTAFQTGFHGIDCIKVIGV